MTVRRAAVLAGATLTVAACTGAPVPGATGTPTAAQRPHLGRVIDDAPALRPLAVDRDPLWNQGARGALKVVGGAALRGESAVLVGNAGEGKATRLVVADAATGRVRWSVEEYGRLRGGGGAVWRAMAYGHPQTPQIVGDGGDWGILADYYLTACRHPAGLCPAGSGPSDETGVALLSGRDGRVRWKLPLTPARTGRAAKVAGRLTGALAAGDGRIALATVAPTMNTRFGDTRLVAFDAVTGRRLWTRHGVQPALMAGGIVLGRVADGPGRSTLDVSSGTVTALDAATGRTRWDLSDRLPASLPMLAAGRTSLVREVEDGRLGPPLLLEAGTGREIARLPEFVTDCQTDGESLIACEFNDLTQHRLITVGLGDREVKVARREIPDSTLAAVWKGHVFLDDRGDRGYEVDRSANTLADDLPGQPIALSDRYAIFKERYSEAPRYSVHRVN
ncbi:PQQ-binding-like beta-propeller repeat protein [Sphaerisporangium sp. TRM90804]|uniref:outer membrane protein assembly factor BamB family protein n=1 Tax=Sphaerisporangium sp. TRM90804 TaxID=3031113 RepID=UPI00244D1BD5|nr:PQQ-binding-like beta-propeller repeat protein [Sphaerisporangium sp. TRM90804]MDH2424117.1 PQQ-binding-like beta-propeller repeat protein [Sphaerisporangium sp. TRM90804]